MIILRVQGNARGTATSSPISVTLARIPTRGNILILCFAGFNNTSPAPSVSRITQTGVYWILAKTSAYAPQGLEAEVWVGVVGEKPSTSISVAVTYSGSLSAVVDVCEYSGLPTSSFVDVSASANSGGASTYPSTGSAITTQAPDLWIGCVNAYGSAETGASNGFTFLDGVLFNSVVSCSYLEKIVSARGAATSTLSPTQDFYWCGCIVAFSSLHTILGGALSNVTA